MRLVDRLAQYASTSLGIPSPSYYSGPSLENVVSHFQTPVLPATYIPKDTITLLNGVEMPLLGLVCHTYILFLLTRIHT